MKRIYYGLSVCVGIILIGAVPSMFHISVTPTGTSGFHLNVIFYLQKVWSLFLELLTPWEATFQPGFTDSYPLFPAFWEPYGYTLLIFFSSLTIAFIFSLLLTYFTLFLRRKFIRRVLFVLSMLEAVPDIFIIVLFQIFALWVFKKTGILVFEIATFDKIYFLPIVCLSLFPALLYYRVMLLVFEEELEQPYVEFAKGRGLAKGFILLVHVMRNSLISIFNHSKYIVWFVLSNYVMIEAIFNSHGIVWFAMNYPEPDVITMTFLLLFLPIYILLSFIGITIGKLTGQKVASQ